MYACSTHAYTYTHVPYMHTRTCICMYPIATYIHVHACTVHVLYMHIYVYVYGIYVYVYACALHAYTYTHVLYMQTRICMYCTSLVPRPSWGGGEGLVRTVCACALISRHSGNSVLRTDNSVFKRHYRILSGLSLGSLREREYNQYTSAEKRSHSLSSVFTTCLWNTSKSTLSRVLSPDPKLDGSLPDLTEGFYRFYSD